MSDFNNSKYVIPKERREKLGEYIKDLRTNKCSKKYGVNELADIVGITSSLISNLENGKIQKINPFLLKDVANALEIDYKILYKMVGFIDEVDNLKVVYPTPKELLEEKNMLIIWKGKRRQIIDLSEISKKGIKELENYVNYLSISYKDFIEFKKWKKQEKKNYQIDQHMKEYVERQDWNESGRYQIQYTNETVHELFEKKGLKLNEKGKEFLQRYIDVYGDDEIKELLKDENGKELTGSKREYKLAKFVRKAAVTAFID